MAEAGKVSISNPVELSALSSDLEKLRELLSDKNRDDAKTKQWAKEAASSLSDRLSLEAQSSSLLSDSSDDRRQYIDSLQQASYIIANFLKAAQYFDDEEAEAIEQDIIVPSEVPIRSSADGEEQGLVQETIRHPLESDSSSSETGHSSSSSSSSSHSSESSSQPLQKPVGVVTRCRLLNNPYPRDEIELKVFSIKVTGIDAGFNLEKVSPHTKVQDFIARLTVVRQNEKVKQSNKRLVLTIPQHSSGSSSSSSSSSVAAQMALSGSGGNNSIVMKPELSIWHYDLRHNDPVFLSYEDDFAQQTIWLKIVFFGQNPSSRPNLRRPFPDTSYRPPSTTIHVPKSCTVRDVLTRAIAEFKNHEIDPYYTGLFLFDDFLSGLWMDESLPISYYQVKDMDIIELKVLPQFQFLKHQPNNLLGSAGSPSQPNRRTSQTQTPLAPQPSEVFRCLKEVRLTDLRKSLSCWTDELIENPLELKIILRKHPSSVSPSVPATSVLQDSSLSLSGGEKTIGDFGIRTGDQLECFIKSKEQPILRFTTIADPSTEEVRQLHALPSHFLPSSFELLPGEIVVEETPFVRMRSLVERDGFLVITNFRSIFVQRLAGRPADVVEWVSHGSIARIDSRDDASKTQEKSLEIFCKNIRFFRLTFYDGRAPASSPLSSSTPSSSSSGASAPAASSAAASGPTVDQVRDRVMYQLTVRAFPNQLYGMFCFSYRPQHERKPEGGWDIYNCHREFTRMMISPKLWRVTEINRDFRYSPTYPRFLIVPEKISDQQLVGVFNFRARHRIPILTYYHSNSATITRSSQPLIGLVGNRSAEDEEMIKAIRLANQKNPNELFIMDARSRNAAVANKARGGGFETDYPNCPVEFLNIKNIHGVRDAYSKIEELCIYPESREFLTRLGSNDWIFMIKGLMMHSSRIAHLIHNTGTSVLLHCSDGWDRTAQLASLSQIFLSPFSRTIHGFMVLIEKDWQSAGFQFATRNGLADSNYQKSEERAPIFLQFIDCVFQTLRQFPCSFEFNESLLLSVLDNVFGCQFGSFLCNNDRERRLCHLSSNTPSLWDEIEARRAEFSNPFYSDATDEVIVPSCAIEDVVLWNNYYLRFTRPAHPSRHDPRDAAAVSLKQTNEALRAQVDALLQEIELLKASKASS